MDEGYNNNDDNCPVDRGGWKSGFPTIQSLSFRDGRKDTHNASVVGTRGAQFIAKTAVFEQCLIFHRKN